MLFPYRKNTQPKDVNRAPPQKKRNYWNCRLSCQAFFAIMIIPPMMTLIIPHMTKYAPMMMTSNAAPMMGPAMIRIPSISERSGLECKEAPVGHLFFRNGQDYPDDTPDEQGDTGQEEDHPAHHVR